MSDTAEMTSSKIRVESWDSQQKVLRIVPTDTFDFQSDLGLLHHTIESLLKASKHQLIFDLSNIPYPNASFIAYVIELTSLLRRKGGDLVLANIGDAARMNFMTFSPFSYLKVTDEAAKKEIDSDGLGFVFDSDLLEEQESSFESSPFEIKDHNNEEAGKKPSGDKSEPAISFGEHSDEVEFEDLISDNAIELRAAESEQIVVHSREDQLYKLTDFVTMMAERAGFDETEVSRIKISIYEAAINIIEHAYKYDPHKYIEVVVKYDSSRLTITMLDRGQSFDFDPDKDYDAVEAAEEKRTGGFGLHIIKRSMDEVKYDCESKFVNKLTLIKNIS